MATTKIDFDTAKKALAVLDDMIGRQRARVREIARRIHPGITDDEIRRIQDFPDVHQDRSYQYEEGQLAGLQAAKITLQSRLVEDTLPTS